MSHYNINVKCKTDDDCLNIETSKELQKKLLQRYRIKYSHSSLQINNIFLGRKYGWEGQYQCCNNMFKSGGSC